MELLDCEVELDDELLKLVELLVELDERDVDDELLELKEVEDELCEVLDEELLLEGEVELLLELRDVELDERLVELDEDETLVEDRLEELRELDEEETLAEEWLEALAELETGGTPWCVRCGLRFLRGRRRSCRRRSGLRSFLADFFCRLRFIQSDE